MVVSDYDPARAAAVADRVGARVETDPIAAIHADDVDAVLIAHPGAAHEEQVLGLSRPRHPGAVRETADDRRRVGSGHRRQGGDLGRPLIQIGFMRRFDAEYEALEKIIRNGDLGRPLLLHCTHRNPVSRTSSTPST